MTARIPPMRCDARHDGTGVLITVEHDPRQSYSRAVDPRAMKYARQVLGQWTPGAQWTLTGVDRAAAAPEGRAACVFRFRAAGAR